MTPELTSPIHCDILPPQNDLGRIANVFRAYERKPGKWVVRGHWEGKRYQVGTYLDDDYLTNPLADRLAIRMNTEVESGTFDPGRYGTRRPFLFERAYQVWLKNFTGSEDTKRHHKWTAKRWIIPHWKKYDIRDIRSIHVQEFYAYLKEQTLSNKTIKNILGELHTILASHYDDIPKMPKFPTVSVQTPKIHPLTSEQQDKIYSHLLKEDLPIFTFMRWTGVRPSEACALQRDCIDHKTGEITIKRAMGEHAGQVKPCTKTNRERTVYIIPEIEWTLKNLNFKYVFMRKYKYGGMIPYNTNMLQRYWGKACEVAGIKAKLYEAHRHSFASQRVQAGEPIDRVQRLMGHTSIKTTMRYVDYADSLRETQRGNVRGNEGVTVVNLPSKP
jgi:integrase